MRNKQLIAGVIMIVVSFMLYSCGGKSTDEAFLRDMAEGLEARWDISEGDEEDYDAKELIDAELDKIEQYSSSEFEDKELGELAEKYIDMLKQQEEALKYDTSDYDKYYKLWSEAYNERAKVIEKINSNYDLPIDSNHQDILEEMIDEAEGIRETEKLEEQITKMLNDGKFKKKEEYGSYDCTLTVENATDKDFKYFAVQINFLDKEGAVIESTSDYVNNWKAGVKMEFQFYTSKDFAKYEIEIGDYEED